MQHLLDELLTTWKAADRAARIRRLPDAERARLQLTANELQRAYEHFVVRGDATPEQLWATRALMQEARQRVASATKP